MKTRKKSQELPVVKKSSIDMNLLELYSACLKNAAKLLEEAELLRNHKHHARAYFLAYTAVEELGKSQVVADYFGNLVTKGEFEAAFRDHKFKMAYIKRYVRIPEKLKDEFIIEYDRNSSVVQNDRRNSSMYIEYNHDYTPKLPENEVSIEAANELLTFGKEYLNEIYKMEYITERIGTKAFTK